MIEPFDPYHLTPTASLNRLRIVDLPGLDLPADVQGKTGYDLFSTHALCALIRAHAQELRLPPAGLADERALPVQFDACFSSPDETARQTAQAIAETFSRRLGYLLWALKRGDAINRAARPDWDDSYWAHWGAVRHIVVAGGLIRGHLGTVLTRHFADAPESDKLPKILAPLSGVVSRLPLLGAGLYIPKPYRAALAFDFGSSFVKQAILEMEADPGPLIQALPPRPVPALTQAAADGQARELFDFMVTTLVTAWRETWTKGMLLTPFIPVSLASYVTPDGQPYERQGGAYTGLRLISPNVQRALSEAVGSQLGLPIAIRLLHDGTAAAANFAGQPHTAVILLGTAIGVGFAPPTDGLG